MSCSFSLQAQTGDLAVPANTESAARDGGSLFAVVPPRLLECEGSGPCNAAWSMTQTDGTAIWFAQRNVTAKLTVVRFQPDDILIRRTDTSDGNSAVYSGAVHGDEISGAVIWSTPDHPGEGSGHWSAKIPVTMCQAGAEMEAADAMQIAQNALMFKQRKDALGCYLIAAKAGDMVAQTLAGTLYYQGHDPDVPQDYAQALIWLKKAASQGSYSAQRMLADMYMLGEGTAADPRLSKFYAEKADEQQRQKERQEDRADRASDQSRMLGSFVMGAVFGALIF
jgi:hypothetical protein